MVYEVNAKLCVLSRLLGWKQQKLNKFDEILVLGVADAYQRTSATE